ncbi:hypothetical protein COBT_002212 [Conglomerata obtusa]
MISVIFVFLSSYTLYITCLETVGGNLGDAFKGETSGTVQEKQTLTGGASKTAMMQQIGTMNSALQQVAEQTVGNGQPGDVTTSTGPNGEALICSKKGLEGDFKEMKQGLKRKCIEKNANSEVVAKKVAKMARSESAKECTVKVDKQSMFCHTRKVVRNVIEAPIYELNFYGNIAELKKHGETLLLAVIENLSYTIKKNPVKSGSKLKEPNVKIVFNELGGLLSQQGNLPAPKKDDPCAQCLEAVSKEANSLEGKTDDCNASCDSVLLNSLVKPTHFRTLNNGSEAGTGEKPPGKNTDEGGDHAPEE